MRFILGFIFFGLLFYGIFLYFPDFFATLVSWAAKVFDFVRGITDQLFGPPVVTTGR